MADDESNGYEAMARDYMRRGNPHVGSATVLEWSKSLPPGATLLDLGCGPGFGISESLVRAGFAVRGVDASETMTILFRERLPGVPVVHANALTWDLQGPRFEGVVAWGLIFLLSEQDQERLFARVSEALVAGGRFLFTAPWQVGTWQDAMTNRESRSLGRERYRELLQANGFLLESEAEDVGENHYYFARKE